MDVDNPGYFHTIWAPIASVGWYIVGFVAIAYYVFPLIQEKYESWKFTKSQQDGTMHKKTDELPQMSANVELARQKLQQAYDKNSVLAQLKEEEEKEKKRQKTIKLLESKSVGKRLGNTTTDSETPGTSSKSKSFKSEYNPLMGDSTRGYRPPKRSCCGKGGGCG